MIAGPSSREEGKINQRFLVVRTDRIGDVVLSTPVLTAIKSSYPGAYVAMLVREYTREVVADHPDLDEVIIDDPNGCHRGFGLWRLASQLKEHRFDVALVLHPTFRLAFLSWLAGIPVRAGSGYRAYSFLFNRKIYQHRKNSGRHELDLNLEMAAGIGATIDCVQFKFHIPNQAEAKVADLLEQNGISDSRPFVVIHPGSGGSALDWPAEKFGQLADAIQKTLEIPVVITGIKAEAELVSRVQAAAGSPVLRAQGISTIKELAALLRRASLVVANSTGPLHIAVAVGTEVIGLYCPIAPCLPERWGPYHRPNSVIMPPVQLCEKCKPDRCEHGNCMELITVQQVFELAREKLNK